jgi:putative redox protein
MKASVAYKGSMPFTGKSEKGHITYFDTSTKHGGTGQHATPMDVLLESVGACSIFDITGILTKKRKTVEAIDIDIQSERAENFPKVFTKIHLNYVIKTPDASLDDVNKAIDLSMTTYCSVSATLKRSGCEVTWSAEVER